MDLAVRAFQEDAGFLVRRQGQVGHQQRAVFLLVFDEDMACVGIDEGLRGKPEKRGQARDIAGIEANPAAPATAGSQAVQV